MRIIEATIYGFGKWKDETFSFDDNSLNIISGKNEAGKSTVHHFLLYVLFGLSTKQREFYRPKTGGALGGLLVVQSAKFGRATLERVDDLRHGEVVCRLSNGEEHGEDWLNDQLSGTNRNVFESIFSFTAADLLNLRQIDGHELGEVLLNIGLTGSDQIYQTEKWLTKNVNDLFRPKGRKPIINQQLHRVDELNQQRLAKQAEVTNYQYLSELKEETEAQITTTESEIKSMYREQYSYEQLQKALPLLVEYHQYKELTSTPVVFPEGGRMRDQQLKEAILPLESEAHLMSSHVETIKSKRESLENKVAEEQLFSRAEELLKQEQQYDRTVHEIDSLYQRAEQLRSQILEELPHLDIGLDAEELTEFTLPFHLEDTWRSLQEESRSLHSEEEQLTLQESRLKAEKQRVIDQVDSLESSMISEDEAAHIQRQIDDAFHKGDSRRPGHSAMVWKQRRTTYSLMAVFLMIVGWLMTVVTNELLYGIFTSVLAILPVVGALRSHSQLAKESLAEGHKPQNIEGWQKKLHHYEQQKHERSNLDKEWKGINHEEIRMEETKRYLIQKGRKLEMGIQEQERLYPFLTKVSIDHWDKLFHLFTRVQSKQMEYEQIQQSISEKHQFINEIKPLMKKFYRDIKWEWNEQQMSNAFALVRDWFDDQQQLRKDMDTIDKQMKEAESHLNDVSVRLSSLEEKRKYIFSQAQVNDEEGFYRQLGEYEVQQERKKNVNRVTQQVKGMLTKEEQRLFRVWEDPPHETEVRIMLEEAKEKRNRLEDQLRDAQQKLADTKSHISKLESSEEYSSALHELESERSTLREHAKEWATFQVALQLLNQTKTKYKNTYLPQVIRSAATYFNRLTGGNYTDIHISEEEERLVVEHENHQWFDVEELSRGTKDQLYVSLRLALGKTMAESTPLPFIIDDAFVHFDEERLEEMFKILEEVAASHQVMLMTWRDDLGRYFKQSAVQYL